MTASRHAGVAGSSPVAPVNTEPVCRVTFLAGTATVWHCR
jgi:hypothetical protein